MTTFAFLSILTSQNAATGLAALSGFATVMALAMPAGRASRLKSRLAAIARERDRLRERRLAELCAREAKNRLRRKPTGIAARLVGLSRRRGEASSELSGRLRMAGLRGPAPEALFLVCRAALPVLLLIVGLALPLGLGMAGGRALTFALAGAALGYGLPGMVLARLIAGRQRAVLRAFPDSLDLLLICIQAGMSVEAALARVTAEISGQSVALAEELGLTMAELSYLPSRWRAYHNLGERTGLAPVKLIAAALAQAERYGTPISQALGAAARECREARLFEAERKAAALPPKLTVPLVVFFLPVLMSVILAPVGMKAAKIWKERPATIALPGPPAVASTSQAAPSSRSRPQADPQPR
jgi:tight adherence protein C